MAEEKQSTGVADYEAQKAETFKEQQPDLSERFKDDPAYKSMAAQIAQERREKEALLKEKQDREAAEEAARAEAEEQRLKAEGKFEEAAELHKKKYEELERKHAAELQERDITTELLKAGFSNEKFIRGSVVDYNPENDGTIQEYVNALFEDEANKPFLGERAATRDPKDPPAKAGSGGKINWDQVKAWEHSDKREERIKAREILAKERNTTGKYPY